MRTIYRTAGPVVEKLHDYFASHETERRAAREAPDDPSHASAPSAATVDAIVNAAFWASLRKIEGYAVTISIAYLSPRQTTKPIHFARPLRLEPPVLASVAPAVERPGIHLAVWPDERGVPHVWGASEGVPPFCFVVEVISPGLLVVKHRRSDRFEKFLNVAVLSGGEAKFVSDAASEDPDCPYLLTHLLGLDAPSSWVGSVNVLVQLAVSMRAHRRGGTLLMVPTGGDAWKDSIIQPIAYCVEPSFGELRVVADRAAQKAQSRKWRSRLTRLVDAVAGLTAVDGATIVTDRYDLIAFGAKIQRRKGSVPVEKILLSEPIEGAVTVEVEPSALGGTRHLSAAQFVHDQRDALALVASQDGKFTVFAWSPCSDVVHAHRIESLLL